jgi:hypothetical protein
MHSAVTGVQVSVTRTPDHARWLAHFCWGLHIVTAEKGKAAEISYSDARSLITFSRGLKLWQQGTCFYVWLWYKRERTPKHSAIWFILGGYAPSYKSDSLVVPCSFYYVTHFMISSLLVLIIYLLSSFKFNTRSRLSFNLNGQVIICE